MISKNPFEIKGQSFSEQEYQNAISGKSLLEAEFNTSPKCNLDCGFCYTGSNSGDYTSASLNEVDIFLKQVSEAGAKTVRIVGIGEPFLDKRILDGDEFPFFELAQKYGITSVVYTNGTLIDEKLAEQLYKHDVSLVTKQYSFSPQVFEEMTGNNKFFTQDKQVKFVGDKFIPRNLEILIAKGFNKETPTRLGVNNVITSQNVAELEPLYQFARFNNLAVRSSAFLHGLRDFDKVVSLDDLKREYQKLIDWEKEFSGFSWQPYGEILGGGCSRLGFNITLDGENFKVCAGNNSYLTDENGRLLTLHNSNLREIVRDHPLFEKIRDSRKQGKQFRCVMSEPIKL